MRTVSSVMMTLAFLSAHVEAKQASASDICKAAIAVEMGRPTKTMKAEGSNPQPTISYIRGTDGQKFVYRCDIRGTRVVWQTYFFDTESWGRWRDGEHDGALTFKQDGDRLVIHSTLTGQQKTFLASDF